MFDTSYRGDRIEERVIQLTFKFSRGVADIVCHALVLTRTIISITSDGSKSVDIVV